ncbi:hypothetical protein GCM10027442_37640 [Emticicia fontis]
MRLAACENADCFNAVAVEKGFALFRVNKDTLGSAYYQYLRGEVGEIKERLTVPPVQRPARIRTSIASDTVETLEVFFDNTSQNRFSMKFTIADRKQYQALLSGFQKSGFDSFKLFDLNDIRQAHYFHEKKRYQLVVSEYKSAKKVEGELRRVCQFSLLR